MKVFYRFHRFAVIIVLFSALFFTGCGSDMAIVNVREEKEANEILVLLNMKGIKASKAFVADDQGGVWTIAVAKDREEDALSIVTMRGYPKAEAPDMIKSFSSNGLMRSPQDDAVKFQRILEMQLSNTIKQFDGILDADVSISVHQNIMDYASKTQKSEHVPLKASVYVKHTGVLDEPSSQLTSKIKKLVASRVIHLEAENVYVIADRTNTFGNKEFFGSVTISREAREETELLGILINKRSIASFRVMIVIFIIILLTITIVLLFCIWKMLPYIRSNWRALFSLKQIGKENEDNSDDKDNKDENDEDKKDPDALGKEADKDKAPDAEKAPTAPKTKEPSKGPAKPGKKPQRGAFDELDDDSMGV
ncbi:MAG: hypothetical protein KAH32_02565 [Chlamydiia bacterium]|nr:hypothetical protein [Chlamydiia bacterium]